MKRSGIVYALCEPDTQEIRYVGQTVKSPLERLSTHIGNCFLSTNRTAAWVRGLLAGGRVPEIRVLEETPDLDEAERRWIRQLRFSHSLLNITKGGFGGSMGRNRIQSIVRRHCSQRLEWPGFQITTSGNKRSDAERKMASENVTILRTIFPNVWSLSRMVGEDVSGFSTRPGGKAKSMAQRKKMVASRRAGFAQKDARLAKLMGQTQGGGGGQEAAPTPQAAEESAAQSGLPGRVQ